MKTSTERTGVDLFTEYNVAANLRFQVAGQLFLAKEEGDKEEVVRLEAELIRTHELAQIAWWDLGRPLRPL
jgi:hypothetical protein